MFNILHIHVHCCFYVLQSQLKLLQVLMGYYNSLNARKNWLWHIIVFEKPATKKPLLDLTLDVMHIKSA